jgi:RNA polymerase sigma-70 factor, ECF subfamily
MEVEATRSPPSRRAGSGAAFGSAQARHTAAAQAARTASRGPEREGTGRWGEGGNNVGQAKLAGYWAVPFCPTDCHGLNVGWASGIILLCAISLSDVPPLVWRGPRVERVSSSSTSALIAAAQAGDAAAFASLYDAHVARVFALCVGMVGDQAMAAELTQDTFVRAWQRLGTFRGDSAFASWLHRIAVNVTLESRRQARRRSLRVEIEADLGSWPASSLSASSAPAATAGARSARPSDAQASGGDVAWTIDVEAAIARLPAGARAVFVLHDIAGYAHAEIAAQLQIAEGTSKAHLFRARRLLRGMLDR